MRWSFRSIFAVVILFALLPFGISYAATTIGAATCTTIDTNWKQSSEKIGGASTKVSDVVRNACAAIGNGCTILGGNRTVARNTEVGGAKNSQHLQGTAIDLRVTPGKEAEFITLAICGLRKVNNCQGGIGLYERNGRKSIHVDVRTGTSSIWSNNFKRSSVATNISDPQSRSVLYGFGDGKCTDGSIQGDYTEEKIYGPPLKYTPPTGFPEFASTISYGDYLALNASQQLTTSLLSQQKQYSSTNGGSAFQSSPSIYTTAFNSSQEPDDVGITKPETTGETNPDIGGETNPEEAGGTNPDDPGETSPAQCEGSGLFGTNFFKTCDKEKNEIGPDKKADGVSTTLAPTPTLREGSRVSALLSSDTYEYDDNGVIQRVRNAGGSVDVFYGVHSATDSTEGGSSGTFNSGNYGQFVAGETQRVVKEGPQVIERSARFLGQTTQLGAYYGFVHGISPMILGGAPRTLLRLGQGNTNGNVHNLFSL